MTSRAEVGRAWTEVLLKERYLISNEALASLKAILLARQDSIKEGCKTTSTTSSTVGDGTTLQLCCNGLYAVIKPSVCKDCARKLSEPKKSGATTSNYNEDELKLHDTLLVKLEQVLFHGLKFGNNPLFGGLQQQVTASGFIDLVFSLAEMSSKKGTSVSDKDVLTLRSVVTVYSEMDAVKARRSNNKGDANRDCILLSRLMLRLIVSMQGALSSLVKLLSSKSNSKIKEQYFAPWSLMRSKDQDAAYKNAIVVLKRSDCLFEIDLGMERFADLRAAGSQWVSREGPSAIIYNNAACGIFISKLDRNRIDNILVTINI